MTRLLAPLVLLIVAVAVALLGDRPQPPAALTFLNATDCFTLDPARMSYEQDFRIANALYDGVVRWNPYTFEVVPGVAERWEVSDDGRVYTFHLREDARWSNGDPVTAQDFRYSWRRALMPDTAADYSNMFFVIAGARAYFDWRAGQLAAYAARPADEKSPAAALALLAEAEERFRATVGVEAVNDRTLRVTLEGRTPYFLDLCAFPIWYPVHRGSVERWTSVDAASGRVDQRHDWTKPPRLVSNGAYVLTSWRFKRDMRLEKNPHYWDRANVKSDSVRMVIIEDANTRVLAFDTGAGDWNTDVLVDYVGDMLDQRARGERDDVRPIPRFGTYFWNFNCTPTLTGGRPNPFHDARVRRAFAMAVNKRDIVDKVRRAGDPVAHTLIPPRSIPGFDPEGRIRGVPHDPPGARALLEEAGWTRNETGLLTDRAGTPFPVVEMLCSTGSYHDRVALAMGAMWEKELGARTRVVRKETKTYRDDLTRRDYVLARGGWFGDYGDPTTFLTLHKTGDGNNDRGYSNERFDALLRDANTERDAARRMRLLEEAERLTMEEELPILPLWHYTTTYQYDPARVKGISTHPRLMQYLQYVYVVEPGASDGAATPSPPPPVAEGPRSQGERGASAARATSSSERVR